MAESTDPPMTISERRELEDAAREAFLAFARAHFDGRDRMLLSEHAWLADFPRCCGTCKGSRDLGADWPCRTLRIVVVGYADLHGWREEWRP